MGFFWWLGVLVFFFLEEYYNVILILLKMGIILGGVIVFIGILFGIWGYWRVRKRKINRWYRVVWYLMVLYIMWLLNVIDFVLFVNVCVLLEIFGYLFKFIWLILGFWWCVLCNFFVFIYKRCIVDFDEKNCECENIM